MYRHPHIIKLYQVISTPTDIFMVMEYVSGTSDNFKTCLLFLVITKLSVIQTNLSPNKTILSDPQCPT